MHCIERLIGPSNQRRPSQALPRPRNLTQLHFLARCLCPSLWRILCGTSLQLCILSQSLFCFTQKMSAILQMRDRRHNSSLPTLAWPLGLRNRNTGNMQNIFHARPAFGAESAIRPDSLQRAGALGLWHQPSCAIRK